MSRDLEISLEQLRNESIHRIDEITSERITRGFLFEEKLFSMSIEAQINWSNILLIPENAFPVPINTKSDELYLLSFEKRNLFYQTAMNHKMTHLISSGNIKKSISSASTNEEIIDILNSHISQNY